MGVFSLLLSICLVGVSLSARVLFLPSTLYPVHPYTMKFLVEELVKRGHEVTWVEYGPTQSQTALPKQVSRHYWPVQFDDSVLDEIFVHKDHISHELMWEPGFDVDNERTTGWMAGIRLCDRLLEKHKNKFDDLAKQKFDTVIVDDLYNPCGLLQAGLKGSVFIYWSMTSLRTESAWANQSPSPPSYLPVPGTRLTDELTFPQRLYNLAAYLQSLYIHQHLVHARIDAVFQKYYPGVSSAFDLERNASINYVNTPPIFDFARPYMPRVNFVGGLHCKNASQLPKDLSSFVEGSSDEDGFVVVSSGFTAQWQKAPKEFKDAFLSAMSSLPSTRFVWQFNGAKQSIDIPSNVIVKEWLPLQDLLGHPKCKAHVSHGGLNSIIESVWHGVPVVGVPLTASGHDNILRVSARGAGILLTKRQLTGLALTKALEDIKEKKYKDEMLVFQDMLRDVPYSELTHAAFWVEFIDRHQEVPHARSGADKLNIFQYFLVDVILFLLSIFFILVATAVFILKRLFKSIVWTISKIFGKNSGDSKSKKVSKAKKRN